MIVVVVGMRPVPVVVVPRVVPSDHTAVPSPVVPRVPAPEAVVIVAVVPRVEPPVHIYHHRAAPCAEHRGDVFRLGPYLVAHHHDVVERGIVCARIPVTVAETIVIVARRHTVGRRLEPAQAAFVGALIVVGQNSIVGIFLEYHFILDQVAFALSHELAQALCARFGFDPCGLGLD